MSAPKRWAVTVRLFAIADSPEEAVLEISADLEYVIETSETVFGFEVPTPDDATPDNPVQ